MIDNIFIGERGTGKTRTILETTASNKGALAVRDEHRRMRMLEKSRALGFVFEIITYDDLKNNNFTSGKPIFIHEALDYLKFCHGDLSGVSISEKEKK